MQLFHFTGLITLPDILRDGITKGEVPIDPSLPYDRVPQAANLTTNGNPSDQNIWNEGNSLIDKTTVRLTVEVPENELTSFREVKEKYRMRPSWLKVIAPYEHRRHWHFAFAGVRPEQIKRVEVMEAGKYRQMTDDGLQQLITDIETEIAKKIVLDVIPNGRMAGSRCIGLKDGFDDSWLFDGWMGRLRRQALSSSLRIAS